MGKMKEKQGGNKNTLAKSQPVDFYKQEYRREIYGEWFGSEAEARETVVEAKALNAALISYRAT